MFKNLLDFSYTRNKTQAVGFYIAYLVVIMLSGALVAGIFGLVTGNEDSFEMGIRIGTVVAILISLFLGFSIIQKKKLTKNFSYLLFALSAGLLAFIGGGLLGLIPVAYLTTRKK